MPEEKEVEEVVSEDAVEDKKEAVKEEAPAEVSADGAKTDAVSPAEDTAVMDSDLTESLPTAEPTVETVAPGVDDSVTVQSVQFASFEDQAQTQGEINQNLDLLMDIKLQMTVELGRTELPVKKVLELTRGSIIELEKVAGEPVELYANGKLVAHGEVVVIEDNFGLRITSITDPEERLKGV